MQNRTPVPRAARPPLPEFTPVPRNYRHDGWTPERQKAFIEALADTGSVTRAAGMVNIAQANCYALRRAPGAESFRRAWEAALDFGVQRLKDIAFERAIEGELIPVFTGGKLMGYRRKHNDALLMFCLRHYGEDSEGRRTTVNYFSTRTSAGAAAGGEGAAAAAEASATTIRTVISGGDAGERAARDDALAETLNGFAGVALDAEAHATIAAALEACAARQRVSDAAIERGGEAAANALESDPATAFVRLPKGGLPYRGVLVSGFERAEEDEERFPEEAHWSQAGAEIPEEIAKLIDAQAVPQIAEVKRAKRKPGWKKKGGGQD